MLIPISSCNNKNGSIITQVYVDEKNQSYVLFDTKQKEENLLLSDSNFAYWVIDTIQNNEWALIERTQSKFETIIAEGGRVTTERILFYVPEKKEILLASIDPSIPYSMLRFDKRDTVAYLVIDDDRTFPLDGLLNNFTPFLPEGKEELTETETPGKDLINFPFDTVENSFGLKGSTQQLENGRFVNAIPGFDIYENMIYLVDAMNFRVLVYDFSGKFIRPINYPEKSDDGFMNVISYICVDEGIIYLCSFYENAVYVLDSETEDVIDIITGEDTENKKFGFVSSMALDHQKNLMVPDKFDNTLYTYSKADNDYKIIKAIPYSGKDQLVSDIDGNSYSTKTDGNNVTLFSSNGKSIGSFKYSLKSGSSQIIGTDENKNVYIRTFESESPDAQCAEVSFIKIMSQNGELLNDIKVKASPGTDIVINRNGNIFESSFEFKKAISPDDEPSGLIINKLK